MISSNMSELEAIKEIQMSLDIGIINIRDIRVLLKMFENIMQQTVRIVDEQT